MKNSGRLLLFLLSLGNAFICPFAGSVAHAAETIAPRGQKVADVSQDKKKKKKKKKKKSEDSSDASSSETGKNVAIGVAAVGAAALAATLLKKNDEKKKDSTPSVATESTVTTPLDNTTTTTSVPAEKGARPASTSSRSSRKNTPNSVVAKSPTPPTSKLVPAATTGPTPAMAAQGPSTTNSKSLIPAAPENDLGAMVDAEPESNKGMMAALATGLVALARIRPKRAPAAVPNANSSVVPPTTDPTPSDSQPVRVDAADATPPNNPQAVRPAKATPAPVVVAPKPLGPNAIAEEAINRAMRAAGLDPEKNKALAALVKERHLKAIKGAYDGEDVKAKQTKEVQDAETLEDKQKRAQAQAEEKLKQVRSKEVKKAVGGLGQLSRANDQTFASKISALEAEIPRASPTEKLRMEAQAEALRAHLQESQAKKPQAPIAVSPPPAEVKAPTTVTAEATPLVAKSETLPQKAQPLGQSEAKSLAKIEKFDLAKATPAAVKAEMNRIKASSGPQDPVKLATLHAHRDRHEKWIAQVENKKPIKPANPVDYDPIVSEPTTKPAAKDTSTRTAEATPKKANDPEVVARPTLTPVAAPTNEVDMRLINPAANKHYNDLYGRRSVPDAIDKAISKEMRKLNLNPESNQALHAEVHRQLKASAGETGGLASGKVNNLITREVNKQAEGALRMARDLDERPSVRNDSTDPAQASKIKVAQALSAIDGHLSTPNSMNNTQQLLAQREALIHRLDELNKGTPPQKSIFDHREAVKQQVDAIAQQEGITDPKAKARIAEQIKANGADSVQKVFNNARADDGTRLLNITETLMKSGVNGENFDHRKFIDPKGNPTELGKKLLAIHNSSDSAVFEHQLRGGQDKTGIKAEPESLSEKARTAREDLVKAGIKPEATSGSLSDKTRAAHQILNEAGIRVTPKQAANLVREGHLGSLSAAPADVGGVAAKPNRALVISSEKMNLWSNIALRDVPGAITSSIRDRADARIGSSYKPTGNDAFTPIKESVDRQTLADIKDNRARLANNDQQKIASLVEEVVRRQGNLDGVTKEILNKSLGLHHNTNSLEAAKKIAEYVKTANKDLGDGNHFRPTELASSERGLFRYQALESDSAVADGKIRVAEKVPGAKDVVHNGVADATPGRRLLGDGAHVEQYNRQISTPNSNAAPAGAVPLSEQLRAAAAARPPAPIAAGLDASRLSQELKDWSTTPRIKRSAIDEFSLRQIERDIARGDVESANRRLEDDFRKKHPDVQKQIERGMAHSKHTPTAERQPTSVEEAKSMATDKHIRDFKRGLVSEQSPESFERAQREGMDKFRIEEQKRQAAARAAATAPKPAFAPETPMPKNLSTPAPETAKAIAPVPDAPKATAAETPKIASTPPRAPEIPEPLAARNVAPALPKDDPRVVAAENQINALRKALPAGDSFNKGQLDIAEQRLALVKQSTSPIPAGDLDYHLERVKGPLDSVQKAYPGVVVANNDSNAPAAKTYVDKVSKAESVRRANENYPKDWTVKDERRAGRALEGSQERNPFFREKMQNVDNQDKLKAATLKAHSEIAPAKAYGELSKGEIREKTKILRSAAREVFGNDAQGRAAARDFVRNALQEGHAGQMVSPAPAPAPDTIPPPKSLSVNDDGVRNANTMVLEAEQKFKNGDKNGALRDLKTANNTLFESGGSQNDLEPKARSVLADMERVLLNDQSKAGRDMRKVAKEMRYSTPESSTAPKANPTKPEQAATRPFDPELAREANNKAAQAIADTERGDLASAKRNFNDANATMNKAGGGRSDWEPRIDQEIRAMAQRPGPSQKEAKAINNQAVRSAPAPTPVVAATPDAPPASARSLRNTPPTPATATAATTPPVQRVVNPVEQASLLNQEQRLRAMATEATRANRPDIAANRNAAADSKLRQAYPEAAPARSAPAPTRAPANAPMPVAPMPSNFAAPQRTATPTPSPAPAARYDSRPTTVAANPTPTPQAPSRAAISPSAAPIASNTNAPTAKASTPQATRSPTASFAAPAPSAQPQVAAAPAPKTSTASMSNNNSRAGTATVAASAAPPPKPLETSTTRAAMNAPSSSASKSTVSGTSGPRPTTVSPSSSPSATVTNAAPSTNAAKSTVNKNSGSGGSGGSGGAGGSGATVNANGSSAPANSAFKSNSTTVGTAPTTATSASTPKPVTSASVSPAPSVDTSPGTSSGATPHSSGSIPKGTNALTGVGFVQFAQEMADGGPMNTSKAVSAAQAAMDVAGLVVKNPAAQQALQTVGGVIAAPMGIKGMYDGAQVVKEGLATGDNWMTTSGGLQVVSGAAATTGGLAAIAAGAGVVGAGAVAAAAAPVAIVAGTGALVVTATKAGLDAREAWKEADASKAAADAFENKTRNTLADSADFRAVQRAKQSDSNGPSSSGCEIDMDYVKSKAVSKTIDPSKVPSDCAAPLSRTQQIYAEHFEGAAGYCQEGTSLQLEAQGFATTMASLNIPGFDAGGSQMELEKSYSSMNQAREKFISCGRALDAQNEGATSYLDQVRELALGLEATMANKSPTEHQACRAAQSEINAWRNAMGAVVNYCRKQNRELVALIKKVEEAGTMLNSLTANAPAPALPAAPSNIPAPPIATPAEPSTGPAPASTAVTPAEPSTGPAPASTALETPGFDPLPTTIPE